MPASNGLSEGPTSAPRSPPSLPEPHRSFCDRTSVQSLQQRRQCQTPILHPPLFLSPSSAEQASQHNEEESHELESLALQDLWSDAYAQLQEEEPGIIDAYEQNLLASQEDQPQSPSDTSTQQSLQKLVQRRLDEIEKSRLTVSVGGRGRGQRPGTQGRACYPLCQGHDRCRCQRGASRFTGLGRRLGVPQRGFSFRTSDFADG